MRHYFAPSFLIGLIVFLASTIKAAESAQPVNILCLGDSLTEGFGVSPDEAWPKLLELELQKKNKSSNVMNAGISGSTSASGPSRMRWYLKAHAKKPFTHAIIALGANDALRGLEPKAMERNLEEVMTLAESVGINVIIGGMKAPPNMGRGYMADYEAVFQRLAKKSNRTLIPFILDGVAGDPKFNIADGIHPNQDGHRRILEIVLPYITVTSSMTK